MRLQENYQYIIHGDSCSILYAGTDREEAERMFESLKTGSEHRLLLYGDWGHVLLKEAQLFSEIYMGNGKIIPGGWRDVVINGEKVCNV